MFGSVIIKRRIVARHIYCDGLLRDLQRSRIRRRNDILSCSVNRALGSVREDSVICSDIRSRRANGDISEISIHRRTGKAGNALLRSIISLRVAVRRQRDVLIIVEIDLVRSRPNRDRLLVIRYWRVAIDRNGGFRHGTTERPHIALNLAVPASVYVKSERAFPTRISDWDYGADCQLCKVKETGYFSFRGQGYFLSEAFRGKHIAVRESHLPGQITLIFRQFRIGRIDLERRVYTMKRSYRLVDDPRENM